jgi:hypothetical protein
LHLDSIILDRASVSPAAADAVDRKSTNIIMVAADRNAFMVFPSGYVAIIYRKVRNLKFISFINT